MINYTVNYSSLTPQEAYDQALGDIVEYIGARKLEQIITDFKQYAPMTVCGLAMYLSIAGIEGYPVTVMHDLIWPYG